MKKFITLCAVLGLFSASAQVTPKFGKGIKFVAPDTSMSMKFQYRMQNLFEVAYDGDAESASTTAQVRRSRLKFGGHAFTTKLKYKAELGLTSRDISTGSEDGRTGGSSRIILDAVLKYEFVKNWQFWVGQTKLPGNRERVVSSADLQFVDRSRVNSRFNIDRDMGMQIHGKIGSDFVIKPKFAFSMGEGRSVSQSNEGGFSYTGRVDLLPLGEFEGKKDDYILSDLRRQSSPKIGIGLTYNLNDGAVRQQGQLGRYVIDPVTGEYVNNTLAHYEADLIFKYQGISSLIEWALTSGEEGVSGFRTGSGINVQVGYLFENNFEIAGRYTSIGPDEATSALSDEIQYTLGVSKYFYNHNLKIQSDFTALDLDGRDNLNFLYRLQFEMQL